MLPVRPANIHKLAQISQKLTFQSSSRVYSSEKIPEKNFIRLGDQVKELKNPTCPEKVPKGYAGLNNSLNSQAFLHNLRWLMQKDSLKQDCYLIGSPPGAFRRHLAFSYAEITKREIEYLCLTRDTTESDIKQRREVKNSSVLYENQCAVNAALNGRILIIEGIEKAERNLLPILNNLLENREINLDDGQFMVSPERYDKLKNLNTNMNNLLRVHEDFRVIAIGLPVPKYKGNLLDPPLRSRFQAHLVPHPNYEDFLSYVKSKYENVDPGLIKNIFDFSYSLYAPEMTNIGLVDFPIENLEKIIKIVNNVNNQVSPIKEISLVEKIYPFQLLYQNDDSKEKVVWNMLGKFGIEAKSDQCSQSTENELVSVVDKLDSKVVTFKSGSDLLTVEVGKGNSCVNENESFIMNRYHSSLLVDMFLNHSSGHDFVLIGPTGCGKTELINKFASLLDYSTQSMHLFKDMSARDLIQQRITETNGDTKWLNSPLIEAAINGDLMILDGIHRLKDDTLMSLRRLIQDRELDLLDGRKLIRHDKFDELINSAANDEEKKRVKSRLMRIDPAFKIIGTAEASSLTDNKATIEWLNSEVLNLFLYEKVDPLGLEYEHEILSRKFLLNDKHEQLFEIIRQLKSAAETDTHLKHVSNLFTLRKLIRMCKKIEKYPNINLGEEILNSCLYKFMPSLNKQILDDFLAKFTFESSNASETVQIPAPKKQKSEKLAKIPDVVFYENKLHSKILNNLYQDFSLGEHLLLIGNQGTGKNKLVDRFLMLTQTPREYLQLHRDTTVHSLTVQPCIKNGVVFYEDSPLVKAIKTGEVLVIDEADKAPLHVTSVLKSLIENGEMILSDGRRIVKNLNGRNSEKYIQMHPDFRMIILANRPGYPFLGNDFFSILGDLLSTHPIDNPDPDSEIQMLRNYAPSLSDEVLKKLISAFGTLRQMSDQGLISYPYSTREIVNVVKHLQKYPDDSLPQVLANVYDFDHFEDQNNLKETFREVMNKHGIPVGASRLSISLSEVQRLPQISSNLDVVTKRVSPSSVELSKFGLSAPFQMESEVFECEHVEKRADHFSEMRSAWSLGAKQKLISDLIVKDKRAYVTGVKPLSVVEIDLESNKAKEILVGNYFKGAWRSFYPNFKILNVDSKIVLYEESTNQAIQLDFDSLTAKKLEFSGGFLGPKISKYFQTQSSQNRLVNFNDKILVQYKSGSSDFTVLNFDTYEDKRIIIDPSLRINNLVKINERCLLTALYDPSDIKNSGMAKNENLSYFFIDIFSDQIDLIKSNMFDNGDTFLSMIDIKNENFDNILEIYPNKNVSNAFIIPSIKNHLILLSDSGNEKMNKWNCQREISLRNDNSKIKSQIPLLKSIIDQEKKLIITQISNESRPSLKDFNQNTLGLIEIIDLGDKTVKYLQVPKPFNFSNLDSWDLKSGQNESEFLLDASKDFVYSLDFYGNLHQWEVDKAQLSLSLDKWKKMVQSYSSKLSLDYFKESPNTELKEFNGPKHGKIDEKNAPHVGGNTWAGGSGGFDTAGLGGVGGPYRLDSGNQVFQVSDEMKQNVPEHVRKAAREMGEKAFRERLKEIKMSPYEHEIYSKYLNNVKRPIQQLRNILESLEAKKKERQWLKNQTQGDLDDAKLVEAITGEKNIYKRRGEDPNADNSFEHEKPKRIKLVVDVSGSMYRFNGVDNRLEREMESVLMVMESFSGFENKIVYDIVGHSGDGYNIVFVEAGKAPKNEAERLQVLHTLVAHAQFCSSGDHTFEATKQAVTDLAKEEADDYFVIVLSDANFDRYGLSPRNFSRIMTDTDRKVNVFCLFIGTLGNQAAYLKNNLPANKAFICMNTTDIPKIMQQIFQSAMLA